jgi:hypothetical protein
METLQKKNAILENVDFLLKSFAYHKYDFISLCNFKKFKEYNNQNTIFINIANLSVFWANIYNVVQLKLEKIQHVHFKGVK